MRVFVLKMTSKELEEYVYIVVEVVDRNQIIYGQAQGVECQGQIMVEARVELVVVLADVVELHASFFDLVGAQILKMLGVHGICVVVMEYMYLQVCCL